MKKQILNIFILLAFLNIALANEEAKVESAPNVESSTQNEAKAKEQDSKNKTSVESKEDSNVNDDKKQDSASSAESSKSLESTQESTTTPQDSKKNDTDSATKESSDDDFSILPENTKVEDLFSPAPVIEDTFASFVVGYQALFKSNERLKHGIFFAIDRGWLFVDNKLLVAMSLDGSVGGFYSLNLNAKLSGRFLDGRIIPSLSLGYGLLNHFEGESQHNLHGASATLEFFVDIIKGIGLEASYRVGLHPWHTIKKTPIRKNIQSFMINIKFMDFSI